MKMGKNRLGMGALVVVFAMGIASASLIAQTPYVTPWFQFDVPEGWETVDKGKALPSLVGPTYSGFQASAEVLFGTTDDTLTDLAVLKKKTFDELSPGHSVISQRFFKTSSGFSAHEYYADYRGNRYRYLDAIIVYERQNYALSFLGFIPGTDQGKISDGQILQMFNDARPVVAPPAITAQPQPQQVEDGGTLELSVAVRSDGPYTLQWFRDGVSLGVTGATLRVDAFGDTHAGQYWVVAKNGAGEVRSEVADVVRRIPPAAAALHLNYAVGESGVTITDFPQSVTGSLTIPPVIKGKPVIEIRAGAFARGSLSEIIIPDSVTTIGQEAFRACQSLASISIPGGVAKIELHTFAQCKSLTRVSLSEGLKVVGNSAFLDCSGLLEVSLPSTVNEVGRLAFSQCSKLVDIDLPDGLEKIRHGAFQGCESLTQITLPRQLMVLGNSAFFGCESLSEVTIPDGITSIGAEVFKGCEKLGKVELPDGVTGIYHGAFQGCLSLTQITLPRQLMVLGFRAFMNCRRLASISLPSGITEIRQEGFRESGLTSIDIPEGVKVVDIGAFFRCENLIRVTIPGSVTTLSERAFSQCSNLRTIAFSGDAPIMAFTNEPEQWLANSLDGVSPDAVVRVRPDAIGYGPTFGGVRVVRSLDARVDTAAPLINLVGPTSLLHEAATSFADPGASALDDFDGSVSVKVDGAVDGSQLGSYELQYTAVDVTVHRAGSKEGEGIFEKEALTVFTK